MNRNIVKTLGLFIVVFFSVFCFNLDGVKAVENGNGNGYAKCYYQWQESRSNTDMSGCDYSAEMCALGNEYKVFKLGIAAYTATDRNSYSWAKLGCGASTSTEKAKTSTTTCNILNYSTTFGYLTNYKKYFYNGSNWKCPSTIYLSKENFSSDVHFFFEKGQCTAVHSYNSCKSYSLSGSDVKQSSEVNEPTELEVGDYTGNISSETKSVQDKANDDAAAENKEIIEKIKNWAGLDVAGTEAGITGDCNLIPTSIIEFLGNLFLIIQVIGILLAVFLTFMDFVKAITGSDEDGLRGAIKNLFRRIVLMVIILILPMIIIWVLNIVNDNRYQKDPNGDYVIGTDGNPLCNVNE